MKVLVLRRANPDAVDLRSVRARLGHAAIDGADIVVVVPLGNHQAPKVVKPDDDSVEVEIA